MPSQFTGRFVGSKLELSHVRGKKIAAPSYVILDNRPALDSKNQLAPFSTTGPTGFTPAKMRHAYGVDNIQFGSVTGDGTGQTIAIIDVYDYPTAASDLHSFDQQFGLADPPSFTKVNETGGSTLPGTDPSAKGNDWELEEALDIEWTHAMAPGANIILVEATSPSDLDLLTNAVTWARSAPGVSAVSMSFGRSEGSGDVSLNSLFTTPSGHGGVTFLASTGDTGAPGGFPAFSPNVVAVGGTTLTTDASGNYVSESGWSGSGGGISTYQTQPAYQAGIVTQSTTKRTIPDVSFDADPNSGASVYDTYDFGTSAPWETVGGTSLASPAVAGLIAVMNQARGLAGVSTLNGVTQTLPRIYAAPIANFHDVLTGSNGFSAGVGYDLVTGRGSPVANTLLPRLAAAGPYVVNSAPTGFLATSPAYIDFNFSAAMDPTSFGVSADVDSFTGPGGVNELPQITGFAWSNGNSTLQVNFTPVAASGLYSMTIGPQILSVAEVAMDQNQNGVAGEATADTYTTVFNYDSNPLQVASTTPANGAVATLPVTSLTVNFNQAIDPSTVNVKNLTIGQGTVTAASVVNSTTVAYTLSGITSDATVSYSLAYGALNDAYGNPLLAYSGQFIADVATAAFPTPLSAVNPLGSRIFTGAVTGFINPVGDTDSYTINLDAGQTLGAYATAGGGLISGLQITNPTGVTVGLATAAAANAAAVVPSFALTVSGTYTLTLSGASNSSGSYTLGIDLNAAIEPESFGGTTNDTLATAQNINGSFIPVGNASRGAVLGGGNALASGILLNNNFETGLNGFVINNTLGSMWHLSTGRGAQSGHSASTSLYFGQAEGANGGGNYNTGSRVAGTVTSPAISLAAGTSPTVDFNYVLQTEGNASYDQAQLQISTNGFTSFSSLASYNAVAESLAWKPATTVSLAAYAGQTVQLRWSFDTIDGVANGYEGWYIDDVKVQAATPSTNYYAFSLNAGDTVTLALKALSAGTDDLKLYNAVGSLVASSGPGVTNFDRLIADFVAPASGTYYAYVSNSSSVPYSLVVTRNAEFDTEPNDTTATARPLQSTTIGGAQTIIGHIDSGNVDDYSISLTAGTPLALLTSTPGDGNGEPLNTLDPRLRLLGPTGAQVAIDDNSAPDGRNALLTYTPTVSGTYYIEVSSTTAAATAGNYVLTVGAAAPGVPTRPTLLAADDTGLSNVDGITSFNNATPATALTFSIGNIIAGSTVNLYINNVLTASVLVAGNVASVSTNGTSTVVDGVYSVTATETPSGGTESAPSSALSLTIKTSLPASPTAPQLQLASDAGYSNSDGITNVTSPIFNVAGTPYLRFYRNGTLISGSYVTGTTFTAASQGAGTYSYTETSVDAAGNESAPSPADLVTIDTTPPTIPAFNAASVTTVGTTYLFTVTFADNLAIDVTSLHTNNILVTGPNSFSQYATFVSVDTNSNGTPRTATYSLVPPGGNWTASANGTYNLAPQSTQVRDIAGNYMPSSTLGTFQVGVGVASAAESAPTFGLNRQRRLFFRWNHQLRQQLPSQSPSVFRLWHHPGRHRLALRRNHIDRFGRRLFDPNDRCHKRNLRPGQRRSLRSPPNKTPSAACKASLHQPGPLPS